MFRPMKEAISLAALRRSVGPGRRCDGRHHSIRGEPNKRYRRDA